MNKRYLNSRKISKIISDAFLRDQFIANVSVIRFGNDYQAGYAFIHTNLNYEIDKSEKDENFQQAILNHIIDYKKADAEIVLDRQTTLIIYQKEAILTCATAESYSSRLGIWRRCTFIPDWKIYLSEYIIRHRRDDIIKNNAEFLGSVNFPEIYFGNNFAIVKKLKLEKIIEIITVIKKSMI
jgi:hypothetical protein